MYKNIEDKAAYFYFGLTNVYKNEDERTDLGKLELVSEELTEDFTAMLMAMCLLYNNFTDNETDLMGFTHILNRLAVQSMLEEDDE